MLALSDDELIARFVVSARDVREDKTVRPDAFAPLRGDCSVFYHRGLDASGIWGCAVDLIANGHLPIGRADIPVRAVHDAGLQLKVDNTPQNHATICGFAPDKELRKTQMRRLADSATYVQWPQPQP